MSKASEIRIPRTTAMFVTNLGRILREDFELEVTMHEDWTFEKAASWELCFHPGECRVHGISEEYQDHLDANPDDQSLWWHSSYCNYPYKIDVYLAKGHLRAGADAVEVRVRITATQNAAMGDMYEAEVWVKVGDQAVQKGHFWLDSWINHCPVRRDEPMPDYPPERIAFWRKLEVTRPRTIYSRRPLQPTTREKRIARQKLLAEAAQ